jgi:hypothetical protein
MTVRYVGIDLGQKGSVSVQVKRAFKKSTLEIYSFWDRFGGTRLRTATEAEIYDIIQRAAPPNCQCYIVIERPMFISKGMKAVASLHENFGLIKGMLLPMGHQTWFATPQQWKKEAKAPGSDKTKMMDKAFHLFKHDGINKETADSVLISEACRLYFD